MSTELKKNDTVPLFKQVLIRLSAMIESGELKTGDRLPNESELCEAFRVSRITVRRAVEELAAKGLLEKKQGKGTFVSTPGADIDISGVSSFHEACRRAGKKAATRVIHVKEILPDASDRNELKLGAGQRVIETLRLRFADGVKVVLEKNHFSSAYSYLTECDLTGSLYNILREYGVEPSSAVHDISIKKADRDTAAYLGINEGTPLLFLKEVIYDQKGRPLHNSEQYIRGDMFVFRV